MKRILASWIGFTDIRASKGSETDGLGPIGQAVRARTFDEICLISDLSVDEAGHFVHWLGSLTQTPIVLRPEKLTGPPDSARYMKLLPGWLRTSVPATVRTPL